MYCYKCGKRNCNSRAICKNCHAKLLPSVENKVSTEEIAKYKKALKEEKKIVAQEEEIEDFYQSCIAYVKKSYERNCENIKHFYTPKLQVCKDPKEAAKIEESYRGNLADEKMNYTLNIQSLGSDRKAAMALTDLPIYAKEANVSIPDKDDPTKSHEFAQYLHKRLDNSKDGHEAAMCALIIGLLLLIIGALFFFLAFKVKEGSADKALKLDSFEFYVFCVGVSVGSLSFITGVVRILNQYIKKKHLFNALNYFRVYHRIG